MKNKDIYQTITNSWVSVSQKQSESRVNEKQISKDNTPSNNHKPILNTFQFKNKSRDSSRTGSKISLLAENRKENTRYQNKQKSPDESIGMEKLADHIKDVEANIA